MYGLIVLAPLFSYPAVLFLFYNNKSPHLEARTKLLNNSCHQKSNF